MAAHIIKPHLVKLILLAMKDRYYIDCAVAFTVVESQLGFISPRVLLTVLALANRYMCDYGFKQMQPFKVY